MIVAHIIGGLGNQMFQYAAARCIALRSNTDLQLNTDDFESYKVHKLCLHHFNFGFKKADKKILSKFISEEKSLSTRIIRKLGLKPKYNIYRESTFRVDKNLLGFFKNNLYLEGYFQSEQYFLDHKDLIIKEFTIATPPSALNALMIEKILNCNAVSLHVRRGDYVTNPDANVVHGTCNQEYYEKSVKFFAQKITQPVFFVFSDDIPWAKENINTGYPTHFVDLNDAETNYEDLRLMSYCKHNIIANSSFSWWGAWLNQNPDKIVIAPQKWFNTNTDTSDLIPQSWIRV